MSTHLVVRDLAVSFNGFMAVSGLDLTISKGELRCLIGPNGAGKTTCARPDLRQGQADRRLDPVQWQLS